MHARRGLLLVAASGLLAGAVWGQAPPGPPAQALKHFEGTTVQTTPPFDAPDSWEVRWRGVRPLNVSILATDGSIVAGGGGREGSVYLPKGGTFHLLIEYEAPPVPGQPPPAPHASTPFERTVTGGAPGDNPPSSASAANYATAMNPPYTVDVLTAAAAAASSTDPATSFLPAFKLPVGLPPPTASVASAPAAPPQPGAPSEGMSGDQARAVVLIKGDRGEGTGFMVKTPDGPAIITNIHVIADNPNLKISTNSGALVAVVSQKCAGDRDLAMLSIQDDKAYSYLDMAPNISTVVQPGDQVITPGNSEGGGVMLNTSGKVLGVGPERVEIDNPIYHGNSGGPVFHPKSGKVLGVVTEAEKVDLSNELDKTSFASRNSAIASQMRYFALRLDTVTEWVAIDPGAFRNETAFLNQFEQQSRRLDAYLNSSDNSNNAAGSGEKSQDSKIYLTDEKIMRAEHSFQNSAGSGEDTTQHLEALRALLFDLEGVADLNMDKIDRPNNFYSFDRERAREEMSYRKALKAELESFGNNIERLSHQPRSN